MKNDFYPKALFTLDDAYLDGRAIGKYVKENIVGRACGMPHDYGLLAQCIVNAGDGDYIETGTFYGASAIVAACVKRKFHIAGKVVCVDPLEGFYGKGKIDGKTKDFPTVETVLENAKKFKVARYLEMITKKSFPFPIELTNRSFNVAYIDGDHWGDIPTQDWESLQELTSRYILFDNYDSTHPSVICAVEWAISNPKWTLVHLSSITAIFEKNPKIRNTFRSGMSYDERH